MTILDIPKRRPLFGLCPKHTEDLILHDLKAFKDITDFINGKPKRFAGFNVLEFTKNPMYNKNTLEKIPFDSVSGDGAHCSFSFQKNEVMKADGTVKMYQDKDNPKERATIVGFDKRFIALPIRDKGVGALVSGS